MPCYEEGFIEEIEHFVTRCILEGKAPLSTLDDAADALSISRGRRALGPRRCCI
jgi:hypothetical protein